MRSGLKIFFPSVFSLHYQFAKNNSDYAVTANYAVLNMQQC